jgi:hypothetical protein
MQSNLLPNSHRRSVAVDSFESQWLGELSRRGLVDSVCPSDDFRVCPASEKSLFVALGDPAWNADSSVTLDVRETVVHPASCRAGQTFWGGSLQHFRLHHADGSWQVLEVRFGLGASGDCGAAPTPLVISLWPFGAAAPP